MGVKRLDVLNRALLGRFMEERGFFGTRLLAAWRREGDKLFRCMVLLVWEFGKPSSRIGTLWVAKFFSL